MTPRALLLITAFAFAQAPARDATKFAATGTAVIQGVLTSEESTPRPLRRALVSLGSGGAASWTTVTDDSGRFVFPGLPAGRYLLAASKPGWVGADYGARRGGRGPGTTIALTDGQRVTANLSLLPGGVIAGRIVDQFGQPLAGVRPVVMEVRTIGGERTLSANAVRPIASALTSTDDRGEYRIYGLPPGTYVIAATPPPAPAQVSARVVTAEEIRWARMTATSTTTVAATPPPAPGPSLGYAPVFYPGTTDAAGATDLVVTAGAERTGVDFSMVPVPMAKVEGVVTSSDGQPAQRVQLSLSNPDAPANPYDTPSNRVTASPQGRFVFPTVRPGRYRLTALGPSGRGTALDLYAISDVAVNGRDIDNIALTLQPGTTMSGKILFEGSAALPPVDPARNITRTQIMVRPPAAPGAPTPRSDMYVTQADPNWTFSIAAILPGRYTMAVTGNALAGTAGQTWMVKSIVMNGRDVTDAPFEIRPNEPLADVVVTFTDRLSEIGGTIFDSAGRPAPGHFVFVFPTDRSAWTMTSRRFRAPSQPSTDGRYRIAELPPGEYFVAALTEFDQLDMLDQAFLEQVAAAAIRVTVKEGERKVQDLRIR
jgi:protocatechuate 3,4-dioxygenase beta subunit